MKHLFQNEKFVTPQIPIDQLSIAVQILIVTNCRASEVLDARWNDFQEGRLLVLPGKKRSNNVILHDRELLSLIARLPRIDATKIFPSINYYHIYRYCKKHFSHQFTKFKKRKNFKVTHGFRYRNVEQVANDEKIRDILHHRSTKSGKFYKLNSRS